MRFTHPRFLLTGFLALSCSLAAAQDPGQNNATPSSADTFDPLTFQQCIARLDERATQAGISSQTRSQVLAKAQHLPRIIELDRQQPEFTETFGRYFERRVTPQRIERGRQLFRQHRELLAKIFQEYGVPPQYLLAFWGLETNYGGFFGGTPVPDALATLACDPRRSEFFTNELMQALRILDAGDIAPERMVGSWAGAMGHTQFMPSVFLRYALDADGDGRRDLWGSIDDALTSAANFLHHLGWERNFRWGREVRLPPGFDYQLIGLGEPRPLGQWRKLGVTQADGSPLPDESEDLQAALLVPAGHQGPAFLVYRNFRVIMGWNRSESYALAVGHLADRIAGLPPLHQPPPEEPGRLSRDQVIALQTRLSEQGFDAGTPDGILGPATRQAIRNFQQARGLIADGYPHLSLFEALGVPLMK